MVQRIYSPMQQQGSRGSSLLPGSGTEGATNMQQASLPGAVAVAAQRAGLGRKAAQQSCAGSCPPELAERVDVLDHREGHRHRHGHAGLPGLRSLAAWPCRLLLLHDGRLQQRRRRVCFLVSDLYSLERRQTEGAAAAARSAGGGGGQNRHRLHRSMLKKNGLESERWCAPVPWWVPRHG